MEPLLVTDNLDSNRLSSGMIPTIEHLPKRPFSKRVHDFITVSEMIMVDNQIISPFIIISIVVCRVIQRSGLLPARCAITIDRWIVEHLLPLILGKSMSVRAFQEN
jgi:hypothetical protein